MITTTPPAPLPRHLAALIVNKTEADHELLSLLKLFYAVICDVHAWDILQAATSDLPAELKLKIRIALDAAEKGL